MLWFLLAFADPPTDEALTAVCAERAPCQAVRHLYGGTDALGFDLQVIELLLSDAAPEEAREPGYGRCEPFEWHVVRYDRDESLAGHRLLLELCNDGYGASGVGEDRVEVGDNRLVHEQMGGSSWRWSQGTTEQLWPPRVLEERTGSWRSPMGHAQEMRWSWTSRSGWTTAEHARCEAEEADVAPLTVAGIVLPLTPPQDGPGPCGAEVTAADDRGLRIHGPASHPDDGRMVVARQGERTLVVDVTDDAWVPTAPRWIHTDHLELWLPDGDDPNGVHCVERHWPARQWGITVDGSVHPGHGAPPASAVSATVSPIDGGHRFVVTLPPDSGALTVVFSDSDDGRTQERLLATSTLEPGSAHTLLPPRPLDDRCTPAGHVAATWDPRWDPLAGALSAELQGHVVAWDRIHTVDDFVNAWSRAQSLVPRLDARFAPWFERQPTAPDLAWATAQVPGLGVDVRGEGSTLRWHLASAPWRDRAARTPGDADDRFVALLDRAWGNLSFTALPSWLTPTWDGGGCNDLGDGEFLAVLQASEGSWPAPLQQAVDRVRAEALTALTGPTRQFPFCDGDGPHPRRPEELHAEVDRILAEVDLSDAERAALAARRAEGYSPGPWPPEDP